MQKETVEIARINRVVITMKKSKTQSDNSPCDTS